MDGHDLADWLLEVYTQDMPVYVRDEHGVLGRVVDVKLQELVEVKGNAEVAGTHRQVVMLTMVDGVGDGEP